MTLDFGFKVGEDEPSYEVRVSMSWEHAASVADVLQTLMADYEAKVGPLPDVKKGLKRDGASGKDDETQEEVA